MNELREAAQAVLEWWDSDCINDGHAYDAFDRLRAALSQLAAAKKLEGGE